MRRPTNIAGMIAERLASAFGRLAARVHGDERGAISVLTVFVLFMFTLLLASLVNVATHFDDKLKMQNAADASAYSGGVMLARGMNAIAFTNHLLCDTFGMTAFLREAQAREAESLTPEILDAWEYVGNKFSQAEFDKFQRLGGAITRTVPKERELVTAWGDLNAGTAELTLPVFEHILRAQLIPEFQRTVIRTIPELSQQTVRELARRHGIPQQELENQASGNESQRESRRPQQTAILWRTRVLPVGAPDENDPLLRTLPAVDPTPMANDSFYLPAGQREQYFEQAVEERKQRAEHYLELWRREKLVMFFDKAKMSQFHQLWRITTCERLRELLEDEYPETNLPMLIRYMEDGTPLEKLRRRRGFMETYSEQKLVQQHLDDNFRFLALVYRRHPDEMLPGLFENPLSAESDAVTFAQVALFVPAPRWKPYTPGASPQLDLGGSYGVSVGAALPEPPPPEGEPIRWVSEGWPRHWDLWNQNWTAQLVPATTPTLPEIMRTNPGGMLSQFRLPPMAGVTMEEINDINTH